MRELKVTIMLKDDAKAYRILDKIGMLDGVDEIKVDGYAKEDQNGS